MTHLTLYQIIAGSLHLGEQHGIKTACSSSSLRVGSASLYCNSNSPEVFDNIYLNQGGNPPPGIVPRQSLENYCLEQELICKYDFCRTFPFPPHCPQYTNEIK